MSERRSLLQALVVLLAIAAAVGVALYTLKAACKGTGPSGIMEG